MGRRGPAQAAFTTPEVKELGELEDCDVIVRAEDMDLRDASAAELEMDGNSGRKKNVDVLRSYAEREPAGKSRKIVIDFFQSPTSIQGDGKVERIEVGHNRLEGEAGAQKAVDTGERSQLDCGLVFRSVGYRGAPGAGAVSREVGCFSE